MPIPLPIVNRRHWSDQSSFAARGIRTLFFYTGPHGDYHGPGDTADKINAPGGAAIVNFAMEMIRYLDRKWGHSTFSS